MLATTLADRALVRLSGPEAAEFLNGLVTQEVSGTLPVWAGLLTPQGKCLFDFLVWKDGGDQCTARPTSRSIRIGRRNR